MDELFLLKALGNDRSLCISALSRKSFEEAGGGFLSDAGLFLYERDETRSGGVEILAKVKSEEAAEQLAEILGLQRS